MKRPLSPNHLLESGSKRFPISPCMDLKELPNSQADPDPHRERKRLLFSLCEVCNIQLNSASQAQVHYNGRSHLRRVKQLKHGEPPSAAGSCSPLSSSCSGSSCHRSPPPTAVQTPPLVMQSALDVKPFMSFPVDTSSPVGLFPNFSSMDPVQKAVINHTFGVSIPPKKKQVISCNVCQLRFNSDSQAEAHYKGSKHARKLKAQEFPKHRQKCAPTENSAKTIPSSCPSEDRTQTDPTCTAVTASSSDLPDRNTALPKACAAPFIPTCAGGVAAVASPCRAVAEPAAPSPSAEPMQNGSKPAPDNESEEEKAKKLLYCSLCKVAVNSLSQLEAHNTGSKHKTMLEARNGAGPIKAYPRPGSKLKVQDTTVKGSGLQNKTFHCEICDVHVNSEIQLKQHISSRRHKDRVAGKPMKPKYSPYNKHQRNPAVAAKLAFQKDLVKPLSPHFISSPFSPSTVPSLSLHPRPSPSIFQTSALPPSFLRAAAGPIRSGAGSILFTPY